MDIHEQINIEEESINLALGTIKLTKNEFNNMSIDELKSHKKIDTDHLYIYALNILIYYKQQKSPYKNLSNPYFPELSKSKSTLSPLKIKQQNYHNGLFNK